MFRLRNRAQTKDQGILAAVMQPRTFLLLCGIFAVCVRLPYAQEGPVLTGYVTRVASGSDFDVNRFRILCNGKTDDVSQPPRDKTIPVAKCPSEHPTSVWIGKSS